MKIFREIFGRIWALWGIFTFIVTFLIIFIPSMITYLIPGKKGQTIFIGIAKIWMRTWLFLIASNLKIRGKQHFRKGETYIVTCNHASLMDVPITCPFIPGANKTIAKSSFTKIPLFGWYYNKGSVLVNRKDPASRRKSFVEMKQTLKDGMHMIIYPEGTRNKTNDPLTKFHDGAFKLAVESGSSIIPTVLLYTNKVLPRNKTFFLWPHHLEMHFLTSVPVDNKKADQLKEEVYNLMHDHFIKHNKA
jgi:1-acyl-sn-glycerol-3-phosphate acyltransferase